MADFDKNDIRNAKRTASKMRKRELRISNKGAVEFNKGNKADVKAGKSSAGMKVSSYGKEVKSTGMKVTSSRVKPAKTNSARKPSMPVKTGVKNKLKTQGKAATQSGKGYMRTGKK
jgi:hypothetical protein